MIGFLGIWLSVTTARQNTRQKRIVDAEQHADLVNKRNIRLINYATRLRGQIFELKGLPEEWPDDLFDKQ